MSRVSPPAPVLVFAVGNPSRGDDAAGPWLAERLAAANLPGVEVLTDFQWQVEHALDLEGRARVIFVDAACDADAAVTVRPVVPEERWLHTSHAFAPGQVLATYRRVTGREPPPAVLLGVRATSFELGAEMSAPARRDCAEAWERLLELCA
jgi:hydrogenase maturation protease